MEKSARLKDGLTYKTKDKRQVKKVKADGPPNGGGVFYVVVVMRKVVYSFFFAMLLVYSGEASAQDGGSRGEATPVSATSGSQVHTYRLYYRWDEVDIDRSYLNNSENIEQIVRHLQLSPRIDSIAIFSYASPEGVYEHNASLASARARAARRFILENLPKDRKLERNSISLHPVAENWAGLREAVEKDYHRWDRDRVISILDNRNISDATREWRLQQLDGGISWKWMRIHLMPELRLATWVCVWESVPETPDAPVLPEEIVSDEEFALVENEAMPDEDEVIPNELIGTERLSVSPMRYRARKYWYPAVKTNLLYDVVTAVNAEVEFPIGRRCSILVEDVFPWWAWGPNDRKYCFQLWSIGFEPRWWFIRDERKDYMSGHFLGVYGMSGKYDFQWDTRLCYQGEYWTAGLTYGYAMPLCKWLNMEFSISAGYLHSDYRHYQPSGDYEHLWRDRFKVGKISWFGPTKAKISLVIPIGKDSHNARSGRNGKKK